jgi:hypothetical protein
MRGVTPIATGIAAAVLLLAGCSERDVPKVPPGTTSQATPQDPRGPNRAEIERLVALGYLDHAEETADPRRMRVVQNDRQRSQPGYRLYCNRGKGIVELIDRDGRPVHAWMSPEMLEFMSCLLLENGDLMVVGIGRPAEGAQKNADKDRFLARLDWNGKELWRRPTPVHHHVSLAPDGNFASLGVQYRVIPEIDASVPTRDDQMLLLDAQGHLLEQRSLYDALESAPGRVRILPVKATTKWQVEQLDLIHANTIEWMQQKHLFGRSPLYAPGNVLVTMRHQNLVAVIEWKTNRLVWAWGQDDLVGPHEGSVLPNGNILIFDNGQERGWSRVIELDPIREQIVWEYKAPNPTDFFTAARGGSQRLPNGNTLITNSNSGYAFEVTPEGETVWMFMNPHLTPDRKRFAFRRMTWYPASFIDAIVGHPSDTGER